jgi:Rrf2 family iron-sulfur cluster assembly transcriptional regulator
MVLTKRVNYGIRGLLNLTRNNNKSFLKKISQEEDIPESYLAKIFQIFVQRGILDSKKGPNGGFYLIMDPKDISIGIIVDCLEGKTNFERCPLQSVNCQDSKDCAIFSTWVRHEEAKNEMLKSITIANIIDTCHSI